MVTAWTLNAITICGIMHLCGELHVVALQVLITFDRLMLLGMTGSFIRSYVEFMISSGAMEPHYKDS